jgi:uncharacterized protein YbcI
VTFVYDQLGQERLAGGELNNAISRSIVRIQRDYVGRGPTKAQSLFRENVIVVLLHDALTKAERSLVEAGQVDAAVRMRRRLQAIMRPAVMGAVESLTGCHVTASMGDVHVDPDIVVELLVLDRPVLGR